MMTALPPQDELRDLLWEMEHGSISAEGVARIDKLVRSDESLLRHYIEYMRLISDLRFGPSDERLQGVISELFDLERGSPASTIPPIVIDPTSSLRSPLGSFVFSHVAAAVILGIGLLVGLAWRISSPSSEGPAPYNNIAQVVGRITALADCAWSKQGSGISEIQIPKSPNPQIPVFLGDRFLIASGLMQITYDTGAKVLLQGPCTYEIDADNGGYLAVGKLTAKVEKGLGGRGPGSGNAKHSPLSPLPSPLFAVRTPTAVVTDLGTEFGVEVESSGATSSHVFQGSVEVRSVKDHRPDGSTVPVEILRVGESARVERGRSNKIIIIRNSIQPDRFVRHIHREDRGERLGQRTSNQKSLPLAPPRMSSEAYAKYVLSLEPVAYYRMERPKTVENPIIVRDSAPGGRHGLYKSHDPSVIPYTASRFGDAMLFRGDRAADWVALPHIPLPMDGPLTFVAWVKADDPLESPANYIATCWGALRDGGHKPGQHSLGVGPGFPVCRWQHIAFIVDGQPQMYLNGKSNPSKNFWPKWSTINWGIGGTSPDVVLSDHLHLHYWRGQIDEVAFFAKALSPETIKQLFLGGMPAVKGEGP